MNSDAPKGGLNRLNDDTICAGTHLFIDMWETHNTDNAQLIEEAVLRAVKDCGATMLESCYRQYGEEGGVTGFAILAESHICVNTWHEERMVAVDVFFCGQLDPYKCVPALTAAFRPSRTDISEHKRLLGSRHTHPGLVEHL